MHSIKSIHKNRTHGRRIQVCMSFFVITMTSLVHRIENDVKKGNTHSHDLVLLHKLCNSNINVRLFTLLNFILVQSEQ